MSAVKVTRSRKASNPAPEAPAASPATPPAPVNKVEHAAAIWAAISKLGEKTGNREELSPGSYDVDLYIAGQVNKGPVFRASYSGPLTVAEDTSVAPSHFPGGESLLLAVALSKLNEQTRNAVLRDVLADYSRGELPEAEAGLVETVKSTCKQIRAMHKAPRKGSVSFAGKPSQPTLGIVSLMDVLAE